MRPSFIWDFMQHWLVVGCWCKRIASHPILKCQAVWKDFQVQMNETMYSGWCEHWLVLKGKRISNRVSWSEVDGRLGSRLRGYHPIAPRPISCRPFVHCLLVLPIISRGAPRQASWETSVSEGRDYGREMAGQFGLWFQLPRKSQGSFTCHKSVTWDRRLYFPSEGRHAVDFFTQKIRRLRPSSNPWSWVPEASMLTTTPPKPLDGW
jgi:hypothetical protein